MVFHNNTNNPKIICTNTILNRIIIFLLFLFLSYGVIAGQTSSDIRIVNWERLKENSQHILNINDKNILANFDYSISLANLGMIEETYEHFELIKDNISIEKFNLSMSPLISKLDSVPNDILLLNYAAFSSSINSKHEDAIPYFKKIIKLEPENIWIINFLAASYIELGEFDKAKKEVKKALKIKDNKYSHLILGFIHYESGNYIKALFELSRSGDLASKVIFDK